MRNIHRKASIYQVYIKSFRDSNGDGMGDLEGVRQGLPYIRRLGVTHVWITPFLCSPQDDNGYDVSDYRNIEPMFGTMRDLERLVTEADALGLGIMMDMVFNHTSSQHVWFQKALAGDKKYQDYYIFRDPAPDGGAPNNWQSSFGGSAWEFVPALNKYYLHLYAVSQPDLNWENPRVRQELYDILRFWLQKGIKGFRFDVINEISKPQDFPDAVPGQREPFINGPRVHEFVHEMNRAVFAEHPEILTVGELAGCDIQNLSWFTDPARQELDTGFQFHHMRADYTDNQKWTQGRLNHRLLKDTLFSWVEGVEKGSGCLSLFWSNHDQPRVLSRFGDPAGQPEKSAKAVATVLYWMGGIPSIFQGEELGMKNAGFTALEQYKDVESINHYKILREQGKSEEEVLRILAQRSRDNGRTVFPWDCSHAHGFTTGEPWIWSGDSVLCSAEEEEKNPDSIFHFYQRMLALRCEHVDALCGTFRPLHTARDAVFAYEKCGTEEKLLVIVNLSDQSGALAEEVELKGYEAEPVCLVQANEELPKDALPRQLMPWSAMVYKLNAKQEK